MHRLKGNCFHYEVQLVGGELSSKRTYYAEKGSGLDASHGEAVHERRLSGGRK